MHYFPTKPHSPKGFPAYRLPIPPILDVWDHGYIATIAGFELLRVEIARGIEPFEALWYIGVGEKMWF